MKKQMQPVDIETLLHDNGFKKTPIRILLLEALSISSTPLSVTVLKRKTKKSGADIATIYRALNAFVEAGIVAEISADKTKTLYELVQAKNHLHHILCDTCNTVESIPFV